MACNAIKKLNVKDITVVAVACGASKHLDVNPEGTKVRRAKNKPLPEFVPRENKIPEHLQQPVKQELMNFDEEEKKGDDDFEDDAIV